ncbi:reverse transcriptase domain-containing protein [Tanacetum coccineum]
MELTIDSLHHTTIKQVVKLKTQTEPLKEFLKRLLKTILLFGQKKLDDALWAFRTAYKTPTGTTPYKLIYGKNCHLPFEIEHRTYWALKNCNPDLIAAGEKRMDSGKVESDGEAVLVLDASMGSDSSSVCGVSGCSMWKLECRHVIEVLP